MENDENQWKNTENNPKLFEKMRTPQKRRGTMFPTRPDHPRPRTPPKTWFSAAEIAEIAKKCQTGFELALTTYDPTVVGSVSSRSPDVVTISKMLKIVENQGFWWILMDFGDFMESASAISTGMPIQSWSGQFFPSETNVSEAFEKVWNKVFIVFNPI